MNVGCSGRFFSCCPSWFYIYLKYPSLTVYDLLISLFLSMFWRWSRGKHLRSSSPRWWWIWRSTCQEHWEGMSKAAFQPIEGGCLGSACSLINPEMLPLLQHFSPLLHGYRAIVQKRSPHMSQDIYLIYTTVKRIHGDFCNLCKNKEKLGMHWSNGSALATDFVDACILNFISSP